MDRAAEWKSYVDSVFLGALLAYGKRPEFGLLSVSPHQQYRRDVINFLYERMNYTPCKSPSREKAAVIARSRKLWAAYNKWMDEQEAEHGQSHET